MDATAQQFPAERQRRPFLHWDTVLVCLLVFIPLFLTKRGLLADDTKIYLYLDPGHLLKTAVAMWNPDVAFGTVTHQNIGYLFPMGPFFWLAHALGIAMWKAQRLWMGTLMVLAALGVRRCAEELGLSRRAGWAAALPYMLTPFILVNLDRTSALLMPWAGLGWMMLFTIRAARKGDWRNPALFALVVATVGGVNATSILMVGFAPLLYLFYAAWTSEIDWRRCFSVAVRIGSLSLAVSIWWLAGLWAEAKFGLNVLRFTESFVTVTTTSTSSEVFRGLGYWYFYGWDGLQPWTLTSLSYMSGQVVPTMSFVVPIAGFVAALCIRWRYRLFAVLITFVGVVVAVSSYPINSPTPFGWVVKWLTDHTTAAFAMRSSNRVVPIVVLGLALLTGAGFEALRARRKSLANWGLIGFFLCVALAMLPFFEGKSIASNQTMPSKLPAYVVKAAEDLNKGPHTSSILGLPGLDFGYYRFGTYNDSIWPGITKRPWISNQVTPEGEPSSIIMVRGLDSPIQDGVADPASFAPIARLFNAGNILIQMNAQYERYSTPLPSYMWNLVNPAPKGLTLEQTYGPTTNFEAINGPYVEEQILGLPIGYEFPKSLANFAVTNPRPLVRTEAVTSPEIVAGDSEGLVGMGAVGLLDNKNAIYFDAALEKRQLQALVARPGSWLVLTDSNQKRLDQFGTLNATAGFVQQANESQKTAASSQQPLTMFPSPPTGSQTVALMKGLASVTASSYGNVITNNPEVQPYKAVDGNIDTAWQTSAFAPAIGEYLEITAAQSQSIAQLKFIQANNISQNRFITKIGITIDRHRQIVRILGVDSRNSSGQSVNIPTTSGRKIRITILGVTDNDLATTLPAASSVGFSEIVVNGFGPVTRGLLLPTSLLARAGTGAASSHLTIEVNRLRAATHPTRLDPELSLLRFFDLPYPREFSVTGFANLNAAVWDDHLNYLMGRHAGTGNSISAAESSTRLTGSLTYAAWSAFDQDPKTAWMSRFHVGPGEWVQATTSKSVTLSKFTITIINDGYRMIPTSMSVSNGSLSRSFNVPITMAKPNGTLNREQTFAISVPALTGTKFKFTITGIKVVPQIDRVSGGLNYPSAGIADITIPGVGPGVTPTNFDSGCRDNLLYVDGQPVPIRVTGSSQDALDQKRLHFVSCAGSPLKLGPGRHSLSSTIGYGSGININNVVLNSGGTNPGPISTLEAVNAKWLSQTVVRGTVSPEMAGRTVVFAQSFAPSWHAKLNGKDLGTPTLIDGASMGWTLPSNFTSAQPITFVWEPQSTILKALLFSAFAFLVILVMAIANWPRRRKVGHSAPVSELEDHHPRWSILDGSVHASALVLYSVAVIGSLAVSLYAVPVAIAAVWLWLRRREFGRFLALSSVVLVACGALISVIATRTNVRRDIGWPGHVYYANSFVWMALLLWILVIIGSSHLGGQRMTEAPTMPQGSTDPDLGDSTLERFPDFVPMVPWAAPTTIDLLETIYDDVPVPEESSQETVDVFEAEQNDTAEFQPDIVQGAAPLVASGTRRRGLNVPDAIEAVAVEEHPEPTLLPPIGLQRTRFLIAANWKYRKDPAQWHMINSQDSINQVIGKTPIFNRNALDITDATTSHAAGLLARGARVTTIRRETPTSRHTFVPPEFLEELANAPEFTPSRIPADDAQFDLVFASNIFSSVEDPGALLDEIIRVTHPGGTIYIQNQMWYSFSGGRETSPWHLISGQYARRRYIKKNGHEPFNRIGVNFFKLRPRQMMRLFESRDDLAVFIAGPRLLSSAWGWTLKIPVLRNFLVQDLIVVAERR